MQIFILLYIEAGSYIQEDEDKWEFMVLYAQFLVDRLVIMTYQFPADMRREDGEAFLTRSISWGIPLYTPSSAGQIKSASV